MSLFDRALPISEIACIPEENYAAFMDGTVQPALAEIRRSGYVERVPGQPIYWEHYPLKEPRATVLISHGFTESADKFRELAYYFLMAGAQVYAVDHRGHGNSYRVSEDMSLTHVDRFEDYILDFRAFMEQVVLPEKPPVPVVLYGHSRGGAIAARLAQEYPELFDRVVRNAPMIRANSGNTPKFLAMWLSNLKILAKHDRDYIFIHKPFDPKSPFEGACCTSRARYDYYHARQRANPHLQNSAASYRWMNESLKITKVILKQENCARVTMPVLLLQAELDTLVLPREQQMFIDRIADGKLVQVKNAKHEIYRSTNDVLQPYLKTLLRFALEGKR
ncbi:MAG: alpha/beta hydrolase [Eubacteriales bacterium]|nr:alpha/beta hydrolase [Eubacteriales bacterium]